MTPDTLARLRDVAPKVTAELRRAGLGRLVVDDLDGVRVRTPFHDTPQVLHDVDDVRWLALDIAHGGRPAT